MCFIFKYRKNTENKINLQTFKPSKDNLAHTQFKLLQYKIHLSTRSHILPNSLSFSFAHKQTIINKTTTTLTNKITFI